MDFAKLSEKARQLFEEAREQMSQAQFSDKVAEALASARSMLVESEHAAKLGELLQLAMQEGQEMTDNAAERVATLYSDWTGKSVTADEVKSVALKAGAAAVVAAVIAALLRSSSSDDSAAGSPEAADGFGDSFEGDMYRFFADKGGLNIDSQVVDQDGCIL